MALVSSTLPQSLDPLSELLDREISPPDFVIRPFFPRGELTEVVGAHGTGVSGGVDEERGERVGSGHPDHTPRRKTVAGAVKAPVTSRSGALRWGNARELVLLQNDGRPEKAPEVPTLEAFLPRFREGHVVAEGLKPSHRDGIEGILRVHLIPAFGASRLDQTTDEAVQRFKRKLVERGAKPKTVNNVVNVLSFILRRAVAWKVLDTMPCQIRLLKVPPQPFSYYEFPQYADLVEAARASVRTTSFWCCSVVTPGSGAGRSSGSGGRTST